MRPVVLVSVVVAAVLAAWIASVALRGGATPPPVPEPSDVTATGRAAAAYLEWSPAERLRIARLNLSRMVGDLPERLGALKEEIALVCDDPAVTALVAESFPEARGKGDYALAAYADLFALVRHSAFVPLTAELLVSDRRLLRAKGVQAAVVQRHPDLGGPLLRAYELALGEDLAATVNTRATAVLAAGRTGGPAAAALLQQAFRDPAEEVRVGALELAGELALPSLDAALSGVLRDPPGPREMIRAAAALAPRDPAARARLFAALDPRDPGLSHEATVLVVKLRPAGAADALRAFVGAAQGEARRGMRTALIRLGDEAERARTRADATGGALELEALGLLAHGGDEGAIGILTAAIDRGGPPRLGVVARGLSESGVKELLPVAERLLRVEARHPAELGEFAVAFGDALLPALEREFAAAETIERARYLAATLLGVGTPGAREILLRQRARYARAVEPALRLLDLGLRSRGAT
jgi:hypothetical protein